MVWVLFWWFVVLPLMLTVLFTPVFLLLGVIVDYVSRRRTAHAKREYDRFIAAQKSGR